MRPRSARLTWLVPAALLAGLLAGSVLITPALGHIAGVGHTWNQHFQPLADARYINVGEKAADADLLDGQDSTAFLGTNASVIGGAGDFGSFQTYPRFGQWFGRGQTDSEPPVQHPMPIGGTVSDLHISLTPAPGTGNSWTITVRKNSADTSVTCTVSNTDTTCEDTGNSVSFSAGDLISVRADPAGAIPTENFIHWTAKFVAS